MAAPVWNRDADRSTVAGDSTVIAGRDLRCMIVLAMVGATQEDPDGFSPACGVLSDQPKVDVM